jgi:hypothetical protein
MKKLGLLSIAAAVALTSSAFAAELKVGADATIKGYSVKNTTKEANEYYHQEVNLNVMMKNDDGITMKAGWVIYNYYMGVSSATKTAPQTVTDKTQPTLDYGYIIAPLSDALTLKAGYVEAGNFGTALTNSGNSAFKPFALNYKMGSIDLGLEEHMYDESGTSNEGGGSIGAAGNGDTSATRVYVKAKIDTLNVGARTTITQYGKNATKSSDGTTQYDGAEEKALSKTQTEVYATGTVAGLSVAAHQAMVSGDKEVVPDAQSGLYAHALMPMGDLTAGVAILNISGGFKTASEFDPTYLTDIVHDQLSSTKDDATTLTVIPVVFKINDMLTFDGSYTTGKVTALSYTEMNAGLNVALGKVTNLKVMYASASGEATEVTPSATAEDGISMMGWKLSTEF